MDEIARKLNVDLKVGLKDQEEADARESDFGTNKRDLMKPKPCHAFLKEQLSDIMLIILIFAAFLSLVLNFATASPDEYKLAWIDGTAILIAVIVVSGVGSFVDWQKEIEFVSRANDDTKGNVIDILRDGKVHEEHHNFIAVGDVVLLKYGREIPIDGICFMASQLTTDEAAMTGESDARIKEPVSVCCQLRDDKQHQSAKHTYHTTEKESHALPSPVMLSGTSCQSGEGRMIACVVGDLSALGEILAKTKRRDPTTPLQEKLEKIAGTIGILGTIFALLTVHGLLLIYFVNGLMYRNVDLFGGESEGDRLFMENISIWVQYFIIGVAIIVVAVPEGLPLAVMISLAYSIRKMLQDANYVKRLAACEIMGGATDICSDKTGTLTLNKMTVTRIYAGQSVDINQDQDQNKELVAINLSNQFNDSYVNFLT
jgi:magnesium-transporting ATPase (P-type)